jgi:ABC-type uncharacterized transport system substrate-binding protein
LFVLLLLFGLSPTWAIPDERGIIIISHHSAHEMVHRIEAALYTDESLRPNILHIDLDELTEKDLAFDNKLIITLGEHTLNKVLEKKTNNPILATMIRRGQFKEVLDRKNITLDLNTSQITAIFLDQPITRQLNLATCIIPKRPNKLILGVILGPNTSALQTPLRRASNERNIHLNLIHVTSHENPMNALHYAFEDADVLLAIPDKDIYNIHTARGILLSAFHHHVPIIGFSQTYVNLGALAAIYSTQHQIALEIAESIMDIIKHPKDLLPPPRAPNTFKVAINYQVARFFSIPSYTEADVKYAIDQMEEDHTIHCPLLRSVP